MHAIALPLVALLLAQPSSAAAQEPADEPRATELREAGRAALREGHIEQAFTTFREAAALTRDPTVWLEVADAADRLRVDAVALAAYERYLEERADAPDRAEIEGRVRVLRDVASGRRYAVAPTGRALVDWNGRPVLTRRPSQLVSLAEWDGSLGAPAPPRGPDLVPFPTPAGPGLGRRLSAP